MDAKDYKKFDSKEALSARLIAEGWAKGIDMRTQDEFLDLEPMTSEQRKTFVESLNKYVLDAILEQERLISNTHHNIVLLQFSHYNADMTEEVLACAVREAGLGLNYLPSYSYAKVFVSKDNKIKLDLNTTEENKRDAYIITENKTDKGVDLDVLNFHPQPGIDLNDYVMLYLEPQMGK